MKWTSQLVPFRSGLFVFHVLCSFLSLLIFVFSQGVHSIDLFGFATCSRVLNGLLLQKLGSCLSVPTIHWATGILVVLSQPNDFGVPLIHFAPYQPAHVSLEIMKHWQTVPKVGGSGKALHP
jgi:hypothetical protein